MVFVKYSVDIKKLAVLKALEGLSLNVINNQLKRQITQDSLDQWLALYRATCKVVQNPDTYEQRGRPARFTRLQLDVMYDLVRRSPSMFLDEVQKKMFDLTGTRAALSTIHRDLHKQLGLSLVKT